MYRAVQCLTFLLVLAACRDPRPESSRARTPDAASGTSSGALGESEPGVEFEAPRLIPAIRAQLTEIEDHEGATEANLTAFKSGVGTLVNAMETDLRRVGVTDSGSFAELGDSVRRGIGGGAGAQPDISPATARQAAAQVERLIRIYEERMRMAAN